MQGDFVELVAGKMKAGDMIFEDLIFEDMIFKGMIFKEKTFENMIFKRYDIQYEDRSSKQINHLTRDQENRRQVN
jgi:hypothetical protein